MFIKFIHSKRVLALSYLANDLIQRSKLVELTNESPMKKENFPVSFWRSFQKPFEEVVDLFLEKTHKNLDIKREIARVVDVWKQRTIYP